MDPSPKNLDAASRAWAEAYIRANYPGNADALIARCGNDRYDGPDDWIEGSSRSSKLQHEIAGHAPGPYVQNAVTPRPDDPALAYLWNYQWSYKGWWQAYWRDKHIQAGFDPNAPDFPRTPSPPEWNEWIPNMHPFDPADPSRTNGESDIQDVAGRLRAFHPNCGGTWARLGVNDVADPDWLYPGIDPLNGSPPHEDCPFDDPFTPPTDPNVPWNPFHPTTNYDPLLRWEVTYWGNGEVEEGNSGIGSGTDIWPDKMDSNDDGVVDCYDGPAEFDDLASSIYHAENAQNKSGLRYGGDGRLGEVTSPQNTAPYGDDIGTGNPNNPSGPDGLIPPGGPLAFNVHGANGYDAGNVLNLEYLTWGSTPTAPFVALAYKSAGAHEGLYGVDVGLDQLVQINTANAGPTDIGPLGVAGIVALADHPNVNKLYAVRSVQVGSIYESRLYKVDVNTGAATLMNPGVDGIIWDIDLSDPGANPPLYEPVFLAVDDIAYDASSGILYATLGYPGYTELWEIDPSSGAAHFVFELGIWGTQGLASSGTRLYTIDLMRAWLATIDLNPPPPYVDTLHPVTDPNSMEHCSFDVLCLTYAPAGLTTPAKLFAAEGGDHLLSLDLANGEPSENGLFGYAASRKYWLNRDFNLDGLLDQGEVRDAGTENYIMDPYEMTPNDGGPFSEYPFNRRRLTEDVIAALDASVNWDDLVMSAGGNNFLHSVVLLPGEAVEDAGQSAGGRPLFVLPAPGMDLSVQIIEDPNANPLSPLMFSDFVMAIGTAGETGTDDSSFGEITMAHEWLHVWEGYPDLYDYDEYVSGIINRPVGAWDIMSGGFVHPCPVLKEGFRGFFLGSSHLGTAHPPWIQVTNVTDALDPWEAREIFLTDYAFDPADAVYYYQNPNNLGERFYFYRLTGKFYPDPTMINFSLNAPGAAIGNGVMIMHTDFGDDPEAYPLQQRVGTHFSYNIVQADGLQQLENGENYGDDGDPFPGATGVLQWNNDTDPRSNWWGHITSDIEISDIVHEDEYSTVTFLWNPRIVPTLQINRPPGYSVVNGNFMIGYSAWDRWGGTTIEFYYDRDGSSYDGAQVGTPATKVPGNVLATYPIPVAGLEGDGTYYFYARLVPGPGEDGQVDPAFSEPRPSFANRGRGHVIDPNDPYSDPNDPGAGYKDGVFVDITKSKLEKWTLSCVDDTDADAEVWRVVGSLSGQQRNATTGADYTSDNGEISFRIISSAIVGSGADVANDGDFTLTHPGANFAATDFKVNDMVRIVNGDDPNDPNAPPDTFYSGFYTIVSVPDPNTLRLASDPGDSGGSGAVSYRVHSFSDADVGGSQDRFVFMTTGKTAYSMPVDFLGGKVEPRVFPVINVSYPDDDTNPNHAVPLRVAFDATESLDENGDPNPALLYDWYFGDGADPNIPGAPADAGGSIVEHTYTTPFPNGVTITLIVTNPTSVPEPISSSETATIIVGDVVTDSDGDGVPDAFDNCPQTANADQADSDFDPNDPNFAGLHTDGGDACDNCPYVYNPDQADFDGDGYDPNDPMTGGDACDRDWEGDGIPEDYDGDPNTANPCTGGQTTNCDDNCPQIANPGQEDYDADGIGYHCDDDWDNDDVANAADNCPGPCDDPNHCSSSNPGQEDFDGDGIGDVCDDDADGDDVDDDVDNCTYLYNPGQEDLDSDGIGDPCDDDVDGDGVDNDVDNCPWTPNAGQDDLDGDGFGDACDNDWDGDGVPNDSDNCPLVPNTEQDDLDGDLVGDVCDNDWDGDGVPNVEDNCPLVPNPNQADVDDDGIGDACEGDYDKDGILDPVDNCVFKPNPDQADTDGDGVGNVCDNCLYQFNPTQIDTDGDGAGDACDNCPEPNPFQADVDGDHVGDRCDNCPFDWNANQLDSDGDGVGDACEKTDAGKEPPEEPGDQDDDQVADDVDNCPQTANTGQEDLDGDGIGDACDDDIDGDGVNNDVDNCPQTANADQEDADGDGLGGACDDDDQSGLQQPGAADEVIEPVFGGCGFGAATMAPLAICGLLGMKLANVRRRRRR